VLTHVVLPTVTGRERHLARTLAAYRQRTPVPVEITVVQDHPTCGIAWREGAARVDGAAYVHLGADDLVPEDGWWEPLAEAVDAGYLPCPVVLEPDGRVQSAGGYDWGLHRDVGEDWATIGWTTVPFMSAEQFAAIGMIETHYCTDTWVSAVGALHGWQTVLRPASRFVHHNAEPGRGAGMDVHARNRHDRAEFARLLEEERARCAR
jgi:hypothetical protein